MRKLADRLHRQYGSAFHNVGEALALLQNICDINPDIEDAQLFNFVVSRLGNGKQHTSGADAGKLKTGFVRAPRGSRRRGTGEKPFDRIR